MMKTLLAGAALILAGTVAAASAAGDTVAGLRWNKRVVIVFAPEGDRRVADQKAILMQNRPGLDERELTAFAVVGDRLEPIYGRVPEAETAADLRRRYDIGDGSAFTAVLIGKDGGVKWRGNEPAREAELFGLIDAMPMRR
jgi:hypothetical protein